MALFPLQPRQPLIALALSAGAGIVVGDLFPVHMLVALGASVLAAGLLIWRPRAGTCCALVAITFFTLHVIRHHNNAAMGLAKDLATGGQVMLARGIICTDPEPPKVWTRNVTARFRMKTESIEFRGARRPAAILMNVTWAGEMPARGDCVEIVGATQNLPPSRNPGQFDVAAYLRRQGVFSEIRARYGSDCRILSSGHGSRLQLFAARAREWTCRQLERDLEDAPEITGLVESMVLGMRADGLADVKELFQRTGTLHLFAVSGLNVAMLGALVWLVLKPLRLRRGAAIAIIIPILWAYALITGLSASCVRATIMGTALLIGYLVDRPPVIYNSLAAAGLAILAWDTNQLFSPGFQFSFALVWAISFLAQRIQRRIEPIGQPDPFLPRTLWTARQKLGSQLTTTIAATLGVTLAAWLGSLLFTAGYFHLFSLAAIGANLVAVPLAFSVLALGIFTVVASVIWPFAAVLSNNANWLCASLLLRAMEIFALIPGGNFYIEIPGISSRPECEITVFDFDSGGAAHVRCGAFDGLIDCGSEFRYEQTLLPYLRTRGINRLDSLILSHGDAQHIGGALSVLRDFAPRQIIDTPLADRSSTRRGLHAALAASGAGKSFARRGDRFVISPTTLLRVLYPPPGYQRSAADDKALVLRLECANARVLFMSDSGFATEQWLLKNEPDLAADIVVKGEHAKDHSGTVDFLAKVAPRAVICTAPEIGRGNAFLDAWSAEIEARGIVVFRQDQTGALQLAIQPNGEIFVRAYVNGQSFRSRAR
jgi:ComEC/Rec2-related protein